MALNKLDEILAAAQHTISSDGQAQRGHGGKRDRTKSIAQSEPSHDQLVGVMPPGLSYNQGQYPAGHPHGVMLRQKSIGVTEEERQYLHSPAMKLSRSLSEDIPPPPSTSAPEPPLSAGPHTGWTVEESAPPSSQAQAHYQALHSQQQAAHPGQAGWDRGGPGGGNLQHGMAPTLRRVGGQYAAEPAEGAKRGGGKMGVLRRGYSSATPPTSAAPKTQQQSQQQQQQAATRGGVAGRGGGGRKGGRAPLVKQPTIEGGLSRHQRGAKGSKEKSSIPIPTIIVKAPSTSSGSGRSSQGSSVDAEQPPPDLDEPASPPNSPSIPGSPSPTAPSPTQPAASSSVVTSAVAPQLPPSLENLDFANQFGGAFVGAARRDRERFRDMRRKSASFFLSSEEDIQGEAGGGGGVWTQPLQGMDAPTPRLRPSKSIDEGMFSGDNYIHYASSMPPAFGLPEYHSPVMGQDGQPKSAPSNYGQGSPATTFIHPLTGKVLDPSSPLGLALAARERALKDDRRTRREDRHFGRQMSTVGAFPTSLQSPTPSLFPASPASPTTTTPAPLSRPQSPRILRLGGGGGGERVERGEQGAGSREGLRVRFSEDRPNQYQNQTQYYHQNPRELPDPLTQPPGPPPQPAPRRPSFLQMESSANASYTSQYMHAASLAHAQEGGGDEGGGLGLMVLPPPAPSIDLDDEFVFVDPLPPPLQFANGQGQRVYPQQPIILSHHTSTAMPPPPPPLPSHKNAPPGGFSSSAPLPSPQTVDSAASSLTSYDSEVANLTQSALSPSLPSPQTFPPSSATTAASILPTPSLHRPQPVSHTHPFFGAPSIPVSPASIGPPAPTITLAQDRGTATLTTTMTYATTMTATAAATTTTASAVSSEYDVAASASRASFSTAGMAGYQQPSTMKTGDWQLEGVVDSGIEELDSHSSDHPLEIMKGEKGGGGGVEGERGGVEPLDPYVSIPEGHMFKAHPAKREINPPVFPKTMQYKEGIIKNTRTALHRQASTNPPYQSAPHQADPEEEAGRDSEEGAADDRKRRLTRSKMEDGFGSTLAACLERPNIVEPRPLSWTEGVDPGQGLEQGGGQRSGISVEGRKLHSPLSGVKASIISELSSKLQQMTSKSTDDWGPSDMPGPSPISPRSPTMHRYSGDFSASFQSPPTARSTSPLPTSSPQHRPPVLTPNLCATPSGSPSHQPQLQPNWTRTPSPQLPTSPSHSSHPPLSPTYSPYPTSPKHRTKYRGAKIFDFQCTSGPELRSSVSRRRAPSPLIYSTERPSPAPPRPSSLPILPVTPVYSSPFDFPILIRPSPQATPWRPIQLPRPVTVPQLPTAAQPTPGLSLALPHPIPLRRLVACNAPATLALLPQLPPPHPSAPSQTLRHQAPELLDQVGCGRLVGLPEPGRAPRALPGQRDRRLPPALPHQG
ncbi:hypothetical protein UPYG_G00139710 [Umbra pygmaea]|uniref:Uncharacterized protein n=1 Tax=Umbra pygmaea TaxID=75934 RepID=A0ABD0WZK4_UMBPY